MELKRRILDLKFVVGSIISLAISLQLFAGLVVGYLIGHFFSGRKTGEQGLVKSLIFEFQNWKIHLHHWFLGSCFLASYYLVSDFSLPKIFTGIIAGAVLQGFCYSDWYLLIKRRSEKRNF